MNLTHHTFWGTCGSNFLNQTLSSDMILIGNRLKLNDKDKTFRNSKFWDNFGFTCPNLLPVFGNLSIKFLKSDVSHNRESFELLMMKF